jgi:hypothetical protein
MYKLLKAKKYSLPLLLSVILVTPASNAFSVTVTKLSQSLRGVSLFKMTPAMLGQYSKNEQVGFLIERARQTGKVSVGRSLWLQKQFSAMPDGEKILLNCLKGSKCNPENAAKRVDAYKSINGAFPNLQVASMISKDDLYYRLAIKNPNLTQTQLKLKAGSVAENLMDKNFNKSGWVKLEGEVGRNGFDGLYVILDKRDNVIKSMIVESKYGDAVLKSTVDGSLQMSKQWSLKKVDALLKKYPNDHKYKQVREHILKDSSKYRIYRLKVNDNKLHQSIEKITPQEKSVSISKLSGADKYNANYSENSIIDLALPKGNYQKGILESYNKSFLQ